MADMTHEDLSWQLILAGTGMLVGPQPCPRWAP